MKEATYGATLSTKLVKVFGGKIEKLSDRVGLGRPDYLWILDRKASFFETKIGKHYGYGVDGTPQCYPWKEVNDLRQFEVCKQWSRHAPLIYAIYYPDLKMSAILPLIELESFRTGIGSERIPCIQGIRFVKGHGAEVLGELAWKQ